MTSSPESPSVFSFLPSSMDKECAKAATTIEAFCNGSSSEGQKARIPTEIIASAIGLVVFSTARIGMHLSGATGSGIIIARLPDGSWGPPSGIKVHGLSAGIGAGVAVYDCICVINTPDGLAQFTEKRVGLGSQVSVAAGPFGAGGAGSRPDGKATPPVYTYTKTRGLYVGIQVDGTVVSQRESANAAFYGEKVKVEQILRGEVKPQQSEKLYPAAADVLYQALKTMSS